MSGGLDAVARTANTVLGSWGLALALWAGFTYFRHRKLPEFHDHYPHVVLVSLGYALLAISIIVRSVFIPLHLTWASAIALPGILALDVGSTILFMSGHIQTFLREHPDEK